MNIFVTSLSDPANLSKKRIDLGIQRLNNLGFNVEFAMGYDKPNLSFEDKLNQIDEAMSNQYIDIIMQFWGGLNTNSLLDKINFEQLNDSKKIFIGYSDSSALLNALFNKTKLRLIYGPAFVSFTHQNYDSENNTLFKILENKEKDIKIKLPNNITTNSLEPNNKKLVINQKLKYYKKVDNLIGEVLATNLETYSILVGTEYQLNIKNKIIFLESAEESDKKWLERYLVQFMHICKNQKPKGLIFSKFTDYSKITNQDLVNILDRLDFDKLNIPIAYNGDFGHTHPIVPIELGREYLICNKN
ncbi:hypothetical protein HC864_00255 [Candidatus Gracilibacteria bacterium]|nr:hypothetical protein [Candidatus Gracilibacteria bacterium]